MIFPRSSHGPSSTQKAHSKTPSGQLASTLDMDEMALMSLRWVVISHAEVLLWTDLLPFLWSSTTKQLIVTEWASSTFTRNGGCLSLCQTLGRFKKSKFNRWLLPLWLIAINGSSGYLLPGWWSRPIEQAAEKKGNGWDSLENQWCTRTSSQLLHSCFMTFSVDFSRFWWLVPI